MSEIYHAAAKAELKAKAKEAKRFLRKLAERKVKAEEAARKQAAEMEIFRQQAE